MAKFWVQRRVHDGLFWQRNGIGYGPLESARAYDQKEVRVIGPAALGLEWVELDDAGQPIEAKPVVEPRRRWALRSRRDGRYFTGGIFDADPPYSANIKDAYTFDYPDDRCSGENVPVLVHPDGTVTLDEPAPAISQPSPYSESADTPIALVPVDDVQLVETLTEEIVTLMHEATRIVLEVSGLERQREEAKARIAKRLRGEP